MNKRPRCGRRTERCVSTECSVAARIRKAHSLLLIQPKYPSH
nr:MAG TPA: hypothetical protein [Caudoviricetes sp.]